MDDELRLPAIDSGRRRLVRAATRLLGPADAEDAVQDAYVRALEAAPPALDAAQAWLLTVMRHLAIDRLRRRDWLQRWLADAGTGSPAAAAPSAEAAAALAQEAARALRLLAAHLAPADGAAVLLHAVFEVDHAEIARIGGRSEAASRQQLRRALSRLRNAAGANPQRRPLPDRESSQETVFRLYLQSLRLRDPQTLWAMLRQPPVRASARMPQAPTEAAAAPRATTGGVVQVGGQLGLVLTLDGVTLCVLPLGVRGEREAEAVLR